MIIEPVVKKERLSIQNVLTVPNEIPEGKNYVYILTTTLRILVYEKQIILQESYQCYSYKVTKLKPPKREKK